MSNQIGSLVIEIAANTARVQQDFAKIASTVQGRMAEVDKAIGLVSTGLKSLGAGFAIGLTIDKIKGKIESAISAAAGMQQLAERTGATVEGISALASVARLSNTDTDALATGLQKLSKSMVDAENGGAKTNAALHAIGLGVKDLKGQNPDQAFLTIAKSLDGYRDGVEKTVVAQQLFGKAGANLLPVMKDLAVVGDLQAKVTAEQARVADEYEKNLKRLDAAQGAVFKRIALEVVPVLNTFTLAMLDSVKATSGVRSAVDDLAKEGKIREWAEDAARAVAFVVDAFDGVSRAVQIAGRLIGGTGVLLREFWNSDPKKLRETFRTLSTEAIADVDKIMQKPLFSDRLAERIAAGARGSSTGDFARSDRAGGKKAITGLVVDDTAAKAGQGFVEQLQRQLEQQEKGRFEMLRLEAAQKGVTAAARPYINALEQIELRNERIKRIVADTAEEEAQRAKVAGLITGGNDLAKQIIEQTELLGMNAAQQRRVTELRRLDIVVQQAMQGASADTVVEILKLSEVMRKNLVDAIDAAEKKQNELNASWQVGARRALDAYLENANNTAAAVEGLVSKSLSSLEDGLTALLSGQKVGFKAMVDSLIAEVTRLYVVRPLLKSILGEPGGGGAAGLLGSLFGGGGTAGNNPSAYVAGGGGDWLSSAGNFIGSIFGGGRASGGPVSAGMMYEINERRMPEVASLGGRDFLLTGGQSGRVMPAQGSGQQVTQHFHFSAPTSRDSQLQVAAQAAHGLSRAQRNL